jgi:hypothetical protein
MTIENPSPIECPVVIFYEMHGYSIAPDLLVKLLPTFTKYGYKNLAIEYPVDSHRESLIKEILELPSMVTNLLPMIIATLSNDVKIDLLSSMRKPSIKLQNEKEKSHFIADSIKALKKMADHSSFQARLLGKIKKHDINFAPVGNEDGNNDDNTLLTNIKAVCLEHKTPIIAYLGISHFQVGASLKLESNNIQEFYVVNYKPNFNQIQGNGVDGKIRTHI